MLKIKPNNVIGIILRSTNMVRSAKVVAVYSKRNNGVLERHDRIMVFFFFFIINLKLNFTRCFLAAELLYP